MSPEILCASEIDSKSDVWSLGVVLFLLLFNYYPFLGDNLELLAANIRFRAKFVIAEAIEKGANIISAEMKDLGEEMLEINKAKRIDFKSIVEHKLFTKYKNEAKKFLKSKRLDLGKKVK